MITAYLVGISTHYEGEDIEIRYRIYENDELVVEKSRLEEYVKPAIVNHTALMILFREFDKKKEEQIIVYMNDPAINDQIRGVTQTKNRDVLKASRITREALNKSSNSIMIKDVSKDKEALERWNQEIEF
ncbi:hypothetical protein [Alkaliphilus hydrothermalis]|uniref:Uncharacterized protein n=1 Tax=Alkaliphilus hydrothermalis TaxID=1482730 RepID=A0ABS2NRY2_9FIRM|nr:hypothetical protein [Alkaliphilus hydrothermalis]MBM7615671.1 hypothetical protein [Alkaliphilus hydrothermalis]